MKRKHLTLLNLHLDTNAAGKSNGVPMKGDILMTFDINKTNEYFMINSIKHIPEGTQYSVVEISKLALNNRMANLGYQCFTVYYINEMLGEVTFNKKDC